MEESGTGVAVKPCAVVAEPPLVVGDDEAALPVVAPECPVPAGEGTSVVIAPLLSACIAYAPTPSGPFALKTLPERYVRPLLPAVLLCRILMPALTCGADAGESVESDPLLLDEAVRPFEDPPLWVLLVELPPWR